MGIVFQNSAKLVLDARAQRRKDLKKGKLAKDKLEKSTKRKLMNRRQTEFDNLVEEASIWMYAIILPTEVIAHGDEEISDNLEATISELTTKLLGSKIDHDKINRVCGKIARNILVIGLTNFEAGTKNSDYPRAPPEEQTRDLLDDKHMTARVLQELYDQCENFQTLYSNARTWREVREALVELELELPPDGEVSIEWFDDYQHDYTYRELGAPSEWQMTTDQKKQVLAVSRSEDPDKLYKIHKYQLGERLVNLDQIIIRRDTGTETERPNTVASMYRDLNYMNLHSKFYYDKDIEDSLRDFPIIPGETGLHGIISRVQVLLHEIIHSASILYAADHSFRYVSGQIDDLDDFGLNLVSASTDTVAARDYIEVKAYGLEPCLALVRRDERDNTNKAEDNADSWAIYFFLRMLILLYPELDIVSTLDTPDPFNIPKRVAHQRKSPLHHCSLFEPLRSRDPLTNDNQGPIRNNLSGYEPYKDKYSGFFGHKAPRTTTQLLEVLKQYAHQQEKKSEKKKQHRVKQKLKLKVRKDLERIRKMEATTKEVAEKARRLAKFRQFLRRRDAMRRRGLLDLYSS